MTITSPVTAASSDRSRARRDARGPAAQRLSSPRDPEQSSENGDPIASRTIMVRAIFQERRWAHGRKPTGRLPRNRRAPRHHESAGKRLWTSWHTALHSAKPKSLHLAESPIRRTNRSKALRWAPPQNESPGGDGGPGENFPQLRLRSQREGKICRLVLSFARESKRGMSNAIIHHQTLRGNSRAQNKHQPGGSVLAESQGYRQEPPDRSERIGERH